MELPDLLRRLQSLPQAQGLSDPAFYLLAGGTVLLTLALAGVIVWMAGALVNAERLTFLRSLAAGTAELVVLLPAAYFVMVQVGGPNILEWRNPRTLLVGGGITLGIDLVLVLCVAFLLGAVRPLRGLLLWVYHLLLHALAAALVLACVLVGLAVWQVTRDTEQAEYLRQGLLGFGIVLAVLVAVFVAVWAARNWPDRSRRAGG